MISDFAKSKYDELMEDLSSFEEMGISEGQKLSGKLTSIRTTLTIIKEKILTEPFESDEEEIKFFKYWKPMFAAQHQLEVERFKITSARPVSDDLELKSYYLKELSFLQQVIDKHQFFYQYFISGSSDLDRFFFLRNAMPPNPMWSAPYTYDPQFGTPGDDLFAQFLCMGWLKDYLLKCIAGIGQQDSKKVQELKWTGEKQNLIEVAYGLWLTKQLNDGNATLLQIITWLEDSLQVDLGNVQKAFANIRSRKRLSPTKYIDLIREEVLKKIEDDQY